MCIDFITYIIHDEIIFPSSKPGIPGREFVGPRHLGGIFASSVPAKEGSLVLLSHLSVVCASCLKEVG